MALGRAFSVAQIQAMMTDEAWLFAQPIFFAYVTIAVEAGEKVTSTYSYLEHQRDGVASAVMIRCNAVLKARGQERERREPQMGIPDPHKRNRVKLTVVLAADAAAARH